MSVPKLTQKEWETIRHLLCHCGRYDHCGLTEKQIEVLYHKKLKIPELSKQHEEGGKFYNGG
ncbi:MAG: hypothetical protein HQK96_01455 [Nitrospirae bacterium]|nr:hypothetical protein [Nitrospirota bacterium]